MISSTMPNATIIPPENIKGYRGMGMWIGSYFAKKTNPMIVVREMLNPPKLGMAKEWILRSIG